MKTVHTETWIGAAAPIVWDVLTDVPNWPKWNPVMRIDGALEPGRQITVTLLPPGKPEVVLKPKIVAVEDGREIRWRGRLVMPGICDGEHGLRIVPEDSGRCRFEQFEVFSGLLAGVIMGPRLREIETGFQVMNRMLKREAERRGAEQA